ncbi:transcriptional regulator NrdR [Candidatus Comchoanobacter bicostacola]|uniref:Transcriptional repressor NrdR n=1 Tax=Candidatus Comchoanobacter bicostacola TaxID=2919598 RepID=A0ABY5DKC9_9GAMM|nr:transcriptional regulator NrdR [Candidatus Comchoanobacter bicostacola]UTC24339.1 transcriptional regulator NrdR [Candidatus Comchoanobacter bicostacola]
MYCPACFSQDIRVIDSRPFVELNQIKRRRGCQGCGHRFSTTESIETGFPKIIKRSGSIVEFDPGKVRKGIVRAVEKRPLSVSQIDQMMARIMHRISKMNVKSLNSNRVGYMIIEELKEVDLIAMVRFATVYHCFKDIEAFKDFIDQLVGDPVLNENNDE